MSARFVKLTPADDGVAEAYFDLQTGIMISADAAGACLAPVRFPLLVRESPAEIMALLAEPAPSVEVTEAAARAALCVWHGTTDPSTWDAAMCKDMRAAIQAADRARGLRP
jgi:hypothetical protein